jgi:hypothetical protein
MSEPAAYPKYQLSLAEKLSFDQAGGPVAISDAQFMADLKRLRELRSFFIEQAVQLKPTEAGTISFGRLNLLRYDGTGRSPAIEEWDALETLTQELFRHLSDPLRRRFLYTRLPSWFSQAAAVLGCVAILSLIACTVIWGHGGWDRIFPFYVLWLASLGGIGAISFIGMNALSIQDDVTFDLSNPKLLLLRIGLGCLFGIVLTLPFGYNSFTTFIQFLLDPENVNPVLTLQAVLLLLPFVLGFSTSLVIMILNQFVEATQVFFGTKAVRLNDRPLTTRGGSSRRESGKKSVGSNPPVPHKS